MERFSLVREGVSLALQFHIKDGLKMPYLLFMLDGEELEAFATSICTNNRCCAFVVTFILVQMVFTQMDFLVCLLQQDSSVCKTSIFSEIGTLHDNMPTSPGYAHNSDRSNLRNLFLI